MDRHWGHSSLISKLTQSWKKSNGSLIIVLVCYILFVVKIQGAQEAWVNSQSLCFIIYLHFLPHIVMSWWRKVIDTLEQGSLIPFKMFTRLQMLPLNEQANLHSSSHWYRSQLTSSRADWFAHFFSYFTNNNYHFIKKRIYISVYRQHIYSKKILLVTPSTVKYFSTRIFDIL